MCVCVCIYIYIIEKINTFKSFIYIYIYSSLPTFKERSKKKKIAFSKYTFYFVLFSSKDSLTDDEKSLKS